LLNGKGKMVSASKKKNIELSPQQAVDAYGVMRSHIGSQVVVSLSALFVLLLLVLISVRG
jgi:hypothetical protein